MDIYKITSVIKSPAGIAVTAESDRLNDVKEFLISEACYRTLPFGEGDTLTDAELDMLESEAEFCRAYAASLRILSYSSQSRSVLYRKLCQKGFSRDAAERAADHAVSEGVLDEEREAASRADYCIRHKYWGKKRIAAELMQKGYAKSAVYAALEKTDESVYMENLAKLLEKKPIPEDKSARDKYIAALCRMGYSPQEIFRAIKDTE